MKTQSVYDNKSFLLFAFKEEEKRSTLILFSSQTTGAIHQSKVSFLCCLQNKVL